MREMINSGQEWLGDIPANWDIAKIDSLYKLRNTKVSDYEYEPLSVTMSGVVPQLENAAKTNVHDDRKLVVKGDFAINSRSDRRGSCGISEYNGSVSLINTVLKPNSDMLPRYFNWLFHTELFADEFYRWGHGIVDDLWTTNWQDMRKIVVPVPSMPEQKRIASFLDSKCVEIDSITTDIQKEIETLQEYRKSVITEAVTKGLDPNVEMKDSGIEWIGEIPRDWNVIRVKDKYKYSTGFTPDTKRSDYYNDINGYEWVTISDLNDDKIKTPTKALISRDYVHTTFRKQIVPGCLLYSFKLSVGQVAITDRPLFINEALAAFEPSPDNCINFLRYSSLLIEFNANINIYGAKILNQQLINDAYIVFPHLDEQKRIASFLDTKCAQINSIIEDKQKQLDTLSEYRKSLIYEYVTGKKEVPIETA